MIKTNDDFRINKRNNHIKKVAITMTIFIRINNYIELSVDFDILFRISQNFPICTPK